MAEDPLQEESSFLTPLGLQNKEAKCGRLAFNLEVRVPVSHTGAPGLNTPVQL